MTAFDPHAVLNARVPHIHAELDRAESLHGHQHLEPGTGPTTRPLDWFAVCSDGAAAEVRDLLRRTVDQHAEAGTLTWADVVLEEVFEWLAEDPATDYAAWQAEADQVVATIMRAQADQRRTRAAGTKPSITVEVARSGRYLVRCSRCGVVSAPASLAAATHGKQLHALAHETGEA